jgi:hypothetical protein
MDDAGAVDKEDLGSTHTRAWEVRGEVLGSAKLTLKIDRAIAEAAGGSDT